MNLAKRNKILVNQDLHLSQLVSSTAADSRNPVHDSPSLSHSTRHQHPSVTLSLALAGKKYLHYRDLLAAARDLHRPPPRRLYYSLFPKVLKLWQIQNRGIESYIKRRNADEYARPATLSPEPRGKPHPAANSVHCPCNSSTPPTVVKHPPLRSRCGGPFSPPAVVAGATLAHPPTILTVPVLRSSSTSQIRNTRDS